LPQISGRAPEDRLAFLPKISGHAGRDLGAGGDRSAGAHPEICGRPAQICAMQRKILRLSGDRSALFCSISGGRLAEPSGLSTIHADGGGVG